MVGGKFWPHTAHSCCYFGFWFSLFSLCRSSSLKAVASLYYQFFFCVIDRFRKSLSLQGSITTTIMVLWLAFVVLMAQHASALTGPDCRRLSIGTNFMPPQSHNSVSSNRLLSSHIIGHSSMSAMNILQEEEESSVAAITVAPVPAIVDWDWEQVAASVFSKGDHRPVVLFDGVCNLCNGGVNFAMDHDTSATLRFCSLQSKTAQSLLLQAGRPPTDTKKIVLVTEHGTFFASEAVTRICQQLDPPWRWIGTVGRVTPEWIREPIYQFVSKHRYQFGENDSCRIDFDGTFTSRFVSDPIDLTKA